MDHIVALFAAPPYYPCLLLVHPSIETLTTTGYRLAAYFDWTQLSIGMALSRGLLPIGQKQRSHRIRSVLNTAVRAASPGPLLCTDIDLLCEPSLAVDPVSLLRDRSRHTSLAVLWPGAYDGHLLSYAIPEHGHYRTWTDTGLAEGWIVTL